jgi:hypothetical protein
MLEDKSTWTMDEVTKRYFDDFSQFINDSFDLYKGNPKEFYKSVKQGTGYQAKSKMLNL